MAATPSPHTHAFLFADLRGYSAFTERHGDAAARELLLRYRELVRIEIGRFGGAEVRTEGDSFYVVFDSVSAAVLAAIAIRDATIAASADSSSHPLRVGIGVHAGEAEDNEDGIVSSAVNIAARVCAQAGPGEVLVSDLVRGLVRSYLPVQFVARGRPRLKGISEPIALYAVAIVEGDSVGSQPRRTWRLWPRAAEQVPQANSPRPPATLPLPDKPSIAVLPFANLSGDPEQEYFADGMAEEIITALARIRWLFVIARNSTFVYKDRAVDVKQVGRELGVRYLLEGSVRKGSNRVRITAQLIDATNGTHLWADRFDGSLEEVFELQDQVAINVAGAIEPTLRQTEIERARRKRPDNLDAYDLYLRALPHAFTAMPEDADSALALLVKSVELEPDFAAAHALIAWCHEQRYLRGGLQEEARNAALRHARHAMAAGRDDPVALATAGFVIAAAGHDYETALAAFDRSFALSSSSALALGFSSLVRAWKGDEAIAVEQANRAIRLSPFDPLIYVPYLGLAYAHFAAGRFEEMAAAASLASQTNPRMSVPHVLQAAALGSLDRREDAREVVQRLLELQPGTTVATAILSARYTNPKNIDALADALRRAGLPEG